MNFSFLGGIYYLAQLTKWYSRKKNLKKGALLISVNATSKPYFKGWVEANSQRLITGIVWLRYGNPDRKFPGPPGWGLDHMADYPTSHKQMQSRNSINSLGI